MFDFYKEACITYPKPQCRQWFEQIDPHLEALDANASSITGVGTLTANQFIVPVRSRRLASRSVGRQKPHFRRSGQRAAGSLMSALIAARFHPDLKAKYQQMIAAGKPGEAAITPLMRGSSLRPTPCSKQTASGSNRTLDHDGYFKVMLNAALTRPR
jgi:transposase